MWLATEQRQGVLLGIPARAPGMKARRRHAQITTPGLTLHQQTHLAADRELDSHEAR